MAAASIIDFFFLEHFTHFGCRAGGRLMRGDGMHGVVDVLHVHLPVAVDLLGLPGNAALAAD